MTELKSQTHSLWTTQEHSPSRKQRRFLRYLSAILLDLTVLNLFVEYWEHVEASSFSITLLAAVLLQALLKLTIAIEHRASEFFNAQEGKSSKFLRFFSAWLLLLGSKFVILAALDFLLVGALRFHGPLHGMVALIVVATTMLLAEGCLVRLYRALA